MSENSEEENDKNINTRQLGADLKNWLAGLFDLRKDKEDDYRTIELLKADIDFRGTKLWILICAILIASLGLTVNSAAVIIGAMLISPLMGPIIGFGLGLGISDFELIKRSLRNLALTTLFSIVTAALFFLISPFDTPQSELLARTQPTIYDVLIAFFGGAAGIIAGSTKNKGNVIPGVAIATALMPPLCTAGFGLATGNMAFFFGAFYLYVINSVFIALATFLCVRVLQFPRKVFVDKLREKRVTQFIWIIAIFTIAPSVYLSAGMLRKQYDQDAAAHFIKEQISKPNRQVIDYTLAIDKNDRHLDVVLLGARIEPREQDSLALLMDNYGIGRYALNIKQSFEQETDVQGLKNVLLKDLYENSDKIINRQRTEIDSLNRMLEAYNRYGALQSRINKEIITLFPTVNVAKLLPSAGLVSGQDSLLLVLVEPHKGRSISRSDRNRLTSWLKERTEAKEVRLLVD